MHDACPQDQALDLLNLEFGFAYELETPWHAVFAEAAAPEGDAAAAHPAAGLLLCCCWVVEGRCMGSMCSQDIVLWGCSWHPVQQGICWPVSARRQILK
jgi:hypothetical protein